MESAMINSSNDRPRHARVRKRSKLFRFMKWALLSVLGGLLLIVVTVLVVANTKDGSIRVLQTYVYSKLKQKPNSFKPLQQPTETVHADGIRVKTNIEYGKRFPNSFLDIWYSTADLSVKRPTIIFLHGGGFFMGSKDWGDPLAGGGKKGSASEAINIIAKHGFNVVNMDYALSPAYRYPTPLLQINEAIGFLQANSDRLGVDMTRLFLMGGSAGAQLSAQYGALLSNPTYAAEVGVEPTIDPSQVKGLVVFSAPLKVSGFGWRMNAMMWAYLDTKDLENSRQSQQMDILQHITPRYPATYITDGNQPDTFPEHAKAMARILNEKNVDHVFNYYEPAEAKLDHGYTGRLNTKHGRDNLRKAVAFMRARSEAN